MTTTITLLSKITVSTGTSKSLPDVYLSLAAYPGMRHERAMQTATSSSRAGELKEQALGNIKMNHVQLVPQNFGQLTLEFAQSLTLAYPSTHFRLHANARVMQSHRVADLSNLPSNLDWFTQAAKVSKALKAKAYTAHSGTRANATLEQMLENTRRVADLFGCAVGVEAQYPTKDDSLLVSSWQEYRQVFDSGVPYAVDLSHLNIVAVKSGYRQDSLVKEMLACERCIEVHVSHNNGYGDTHQVCDTQPWWFPMLEYIHPQATVFTEGNHLRKLKK